MDCNCININNGGAVFRHVYGNVLRMAIPLTVRTVELVDGEATATDADFIPSQDYPVEVVLQRENRRAITIEATMRDGNIAYIEDLGTVPVGHYAITVMCKDDNGNPYRFKQNDVLNVVDTTAEAGIEKGIEYDVTVWYLDSAIYLVLKGEDGVGIEDIVTETSDEIGGTNTITIVLSDGRQKSFTVLNGSGAVDGNFNPNSNHPVSNSVITERFNAVDTAIAGLFGDVDYDSQTKSIRFYNKNKSAILATLDAKPFIKDGMVNSVYISNNTLVITFNTDAGREAIGVPLTSVFNPNNYYTKVQVDSRIATALDNLNLSNYYTKSQTDRIVGRKADVSNDGKVPASESTPVVLDYIYAPQSGSPIIPINPQAGEVIYFANEHKIRRYYYANAGQSGGLPTVVYVEETPSKNVVYYNKDDEKFYLYDVGSLSMVEIETGSGSGGYEPPVGGIPKSDLASDVQTSLGKADTALQSQEQVDWNESDNSDPAFIKNKPTIPDVSGFVTASDVADAVADLVNSAPETLDTLKELADALGDDPNFATTMTTSLGNKVDKVTGKGLSTEDYTTAEKSKLEGLSNYDDTALQAAVAGKVDKETGKSLMTDAEHTKLAGIASGAEVNVQADWNETNTSSDAYIANKPTIPAAQVQTDWNASSGMGVILNKPNLATVATSGSYNDLTNKPTIPAAVTVDSSLTGSSQTNPVQGGAIYSALQRKVEVEHLSFEYDDVEDTFTFYDSEGNTITDVEFRDICNSKYVFLFDSGNGVPLAPTELETDSWRFLGNLGSTDWVTASFYWSSSTNNLDGDYSYSEVVPTTRKVNNKALSSDITLTASDVGALPSSTSIPTKTSDLTNDSGFLTKVFYKGTCSTSASAMPKVCTVETFPTTTSGNVTHAKDGTIIAVTYGASDTNTTAAPSLNVNSIGAKAISYSNAIVTSEAKNTTVAGTKNNTHYYYYDSTLDSGNGAWVFIVKAPDLNTTYSAMTQAEVDAGSSTTGRIISPKMLRDNFYTEGEVDTLLGAKANSSSLATVATSGSYNDLSNKPTLFSGNYNDLSNKPSIPAAQVNADWNASSGVMEILNKPTIPTKFSDLVDDSDYITAQDVASIVVGSADVVITETQSHICITFVTTSISFTPNTTMSLWAGQKVGTLTVSGTHLKQDITLTVPANFTAQVSGGTAAQSITIPQTGGEVTGVSVTITYTGADSGSYNGSITATSGSTTASVGLVYSQYQGATIIAGTIGTIKAAIGGSRIGELNVSGVNLEGDITASVGSGDFAICATQNGTYGTTATISKASAEASGGATLYVKYTPSSGTSTASGTLTLTTSKDGSTTTESVSLQGAVSTLTLSTNSVSISTDQGVAEYGTFTIRGSNLTNGVTLALTDANSVFSLSKNSLTKAEAEAGETITVTYNSSNVGSHSGSISVVWDGGTESVTLSGTAAEVPNFSNDNNHRLIIGGIAYGVISDGNGGWKEELAVYNKEFSSAAPSSAGRYTGEVIIPSKINALLDGSPTEFDVTTINAHAFNSSTGMTKLVIPDSVTSAGAAFLYITSGNLKYLSFGNGLINAKVDGVDISTIPTSGGTGPVVRTGLTYLDLGTGIKRTTGMEFKMAETGTLVVRNPDGVVSLSGNFAYSGSSLTPSNAGYLKVPLSLVQSYKDAKGWGTVNGGGWYLFDPNKISAIE